MSSPSAARRWQLWLILHLAAVAALLAWVQLQTRPVTLTEAGAPGEVRIRCVSYSPFYGPGQSPLDPSAHVAPEQIRADLQALSRLTGCVRIYAVAQGLEAVPPLARELGLQVLLGAWIGADPAVNRKQLDGAVALANAYPETVRALVVGNEVLLRRELAPEALKALIVEARGRVKVPVTYADVWEFWMRHQGLLEAVDFATVHILPFWEDDPIGIEHAVDHVAAIRAKVEQAFGKPVLIGETGWPAAGRQREEAAPSLVNQARFVRELLARANREGWDYNLIEAVDQPWKRILEGTVGGHWGILDTRLEHKFELTGPVAERAGWGRLPMLALAGALAAGLLAGALRHRHAAGGWRAAAFAASGLWAGLSAGLLLEHAELAWRTAREWWVLGAVSALGGLWLLAAAAALPDEGLAGALRREPAAALRWLARGRLALLFCAAVAALWLAADPRYRDFPWWMYAGVAPALALPALAPRRGGREEGLCALVVLCAGVARWTMEPANPQAIGWLALCGLLAFAGRPPRKDQQRQ